jgi:hypothetical protein
LFVNTGFMMQICQPKLTIDVAPCFVLQANWSLPGILLNNGLCHGVIFCSTCSYYDRGTSLVTFLSNNNQMPKKSCLLHNILMMKVSLHMVVACLTIRPKLVSIFNRLMACSNHQNMLFTYIIEYAMYLHHI